MTADPDRTPEQEPRRLRSAAVRERATRTQPALRNALLVLLEEKPLEQITVREITERAGVGYATFFRRYTDKEECLHDLAAAEIGNLLSLTLPILHTVDRRASAQALCAYVWAHRSLWTALLNGGAAAIMKEELVRQAQRIAEAQPHLDAWPPKDVKVVSSVAATVEILAWWLRQPSPPAVRRVAQIVDQLVITPSASKSKGARAGVRAA